MSKSRPRAAKRRPRASQTPPKLSPRPSQIHVFPCFDAFFFTFKICIDFASIFSCFFIDFQGLDPYETLRGRTNFEDRRFRRKCEKSSKNPPEILPKSSRNPPKIDENLKKIDKNCHDDLWSQKMRKKCQTLRKIAQHGPKTPQKEGNNFGWRSPRCPVWPPKQPL